MGPMGPQRPQEGRGRPPWALWGPKGPRGGYGEAAPGRESPRAESDPAAPPSLGRIFASAPKSESDPGFLVEKKVEIWPIWTHSGRGSGLHGAGLHGVGCL